MGSRRSTCRLTLISALAARGYWAAASVIEGWRCFWKRKWWKASGFGGVVLAVRLVRLDNGCERRDPFVVSAEPHHDHALRRAPEPLHLLDRDPDHRARRRDEHHLVAVADDPRADQVTARFGQLDGLDSHAATPLDRVLRDTGPFAVTVLGHDKEVCVVLGDVDRDHLVALPQLHPRDAGRIAAHRPGVGLVEADRLPLPR